MAAKKFMSAKAAKRMETIERKRKSTPTTEKKAPELEQAAAPTMGPEERAEAIDGADPEQRAEAVEAIDATPAPEQPAAEPAPTPEPVPAEDPAPLLQALGFEKTDTVVAEVRDAELLDALYTFRDSADDGAKRTAEGVIASAGYFQRPRISATFGGGPADVAMTAPASTDTAPRAPVATDAPTAPTPADAPDARTRMTRIRLTEKVAKRMNLLFPTMRRITEDTIEVNEQVLERLRKYRKPGESDSDVIMRQLDFHVDGEIQKLLASPEAQASSTDATVAEPAAPIERAPATYEAEFAGKRIRVTIPENEEGAPAAAAPEQPAAPGPDLEALRATVEREKAHVETLEQEAAKRIAEAKEAHRDAVAVYRAACKKAGMACEDGQGRAPNVSERVSFEVEVQGDVVRIAVKGKPETEEKVPLEQVRESANKTATTFCERHIGPRDVVGNKAGSLGNRIRAVLAGAK